MKITRDCLQDDNVNLTYRSARSKTLCKEMRDQRCDIEGKKRMQSGLQQPVTTLLRLEPELWKLHFWRPGRTQVFSSYPNSQATEYARFQRVNQLFVEKQFCLRPEELCTLSLLKDENRGAFLLYVLVDRFWRTPHEGTDQCVLWFKISLDIRICLEYISES